MATLAETEVYRIPTARIIKVTGGTLTQALYRVERILADGSTEFVTSTYNPLRAREHAHGRL